MNGLIEKKIKRSIIMRNRFKSNTKPFWWVNKNNNYSFTILEVIEEEIEDTIFFIQENKNNLPHTLEYHN